jgi:hypothetical protein
MALDPVVTVAFEGAHPWQRIDQGSNIVLGSPPSETPRPRTITATYDPRRLQLDLKVSV